MCTLTLSGDMINDHIHQRAQTLYCTLPHAICVGSTLCYSHLSLHFPYLQMRRE